MYWVFPIEFPVIRSIVNWLETDLSLGKFYGIKEFHTIIFLRAENFPYKLLTGQENILVFNGRDL